VAFLAGVGTRVGYGTDGRRLLLTHPLELPEWRSTRHEVFYYLEIVKQLGRLQNLSSSTATKEAFREPDGSLRVEAARRGAALDLLRSHGVETHLDRERRPLVALCPGSINSRAKRWPAERYAALADRFIRDLGGQVVLIGSNDEVDVSQEVSGLMREKAVILTGQTNLEQVVGVLSEVDLLVTNDTGPAHIASALGRPTLVIFGPTNPLTTAPFSAAGEIIRHPPECAPCMLRECPIDHRCMTAISPDEVFERARVMLSGEILHRASAGEVDVG